MSTQYSFLRKLITATFVFAALFGFVSLVNPSKAEARSGAISSVTFPNPEASDPGLPMYSTVGAGDFDGGLSASIISTDKAGTVGILIEDGQWCNNTPPGGVRGLDLPSPGNGEVPMFTMAYNISGIDSNLFFIGDPRARVDSSPTEQCANRDMSMSFEMTEADKNPTTGVYSVIFWAYGVRQAGVPAYGAAENSFRISVGGPAGSNARATFMPKQGNFKSAFFNLSNRNHASNAYAYYSVDFTPPCSVRTQQEVSMQFYDADNGRYQDTGSYPPLTYNLQEGPVGSINANSAVYVKFGVNVPRPNPGNINGGSGEYSDELFSNIDGQHSYRITVAGLTYINAISFTISIPVDILTSSNNCTTPTPGTCDISAVVNRDTGGPVYPGDPVRFNVNTHGISSGRQLGVNGPTADSGRGVTSNYLVSGGQYARGSPVGVGVVNSSGGGLLNPDGTTTIDDIMLTSESSGPVTITAPSTPGTYDFNWKLVNPGVAWDESITCGGSIIVAPYRNVTISGRLYDVEDMTGIPYAGISIFTCVPNGTPGYSGAPTTDGNGMYSFTVREGTQFCIRANSWPQYSDAGGVRPIGEGYILGCSGSGFTGSGGGDYKNPNYCTEQSTYECQRAGVDWASDCGVDGVDRASDNGYDIAFHIPKVTIQGSMVNAYNFGTKYSGILVTTNIPGLTATSGADGSYSFQVRKGSGIAIYVGGLPAGAAGYNVRPWGENYDTCPAYYTPPAGTTSYCADYAAYDWQRAGIDSTEGNPWSRYDRASDTGFDFAFRFPPKLSCSVVAGALTEPGEPYAPTMSVTSQSSLNDAPVANGSATVATPGLGTSSGSFGALANGASTGVPLTPASFPTSATGTFDANGSATATGDGYTSAAATCPSKKIIATLPYLKTYGADAWAGGSYASTTCSSTNSGAYAFAKGNDVTASGASNQFGVMALLNIKGYFSASSRTADPLANKGLSFSNTGGDGTYGGNFDGSGICMPDYYTLTQDPSLTSNSVSPSQQVWVPPVAAVAAVPAVPATPAIPARAAVPATPGQPYIAPTPYIPEQYNQYNFSPYANVADSWPAPYPAYWGPPGFYGYNVVDGNLGTDWAVSGVPTRYVGDYEAPAQQPGAVYLYMGWGFRMISNTIVLHDRTNATDNITSGRICFSDYNNGWCVPFGQLNDYGAGYVINFPTRSFTAITIRIDSVRPGTLNAGLSDAEVYYSELRSYAVPATPGQAYIAPTPYIPAQPFVPANPGSPAVAAVAGVPGHFVPQTYAGGKSRFVITGSGIETLGDINIPIGSQIATYVDHSVYITKNIQYNTGPRASKNDIPFFALIVKGNIYIDPSVTRLDGLYIAQPKTLNDANAKDGRIYTCAPGGIKPTAANIYPACSGSPLTVNGSLIAQQVKFFRTVFSLKDSTQREVPDFGTGQGNKAAETINYSPEMYMAPSPLYDWTAKDVDNKNYKKYDAIFSLPPVY